MIYGYIRVSSKGQNTARQLVEFNKLPPELKIEKIFREKESGKSFKKRLEYQKLKALLDEGDTLVVVSLDRLGRNYAEIIQEVNEIRNKGVHLHIIDMPIMNLKIDGLETRFLQDLILNVLSYVAEKERENIKERQMQGIKVAMANGVRFGRPKKQLTAEQQKGILNYCLHPENVEATMSRLGIKRGTFFRLVKEKRKELKL